MPFLALNSTGFQVGYRSESFTMPSATIVGLAHFPSLLVAIQMHTSLAPSPDPPNQAANNMCEPIGTMVDAWHCRKAGESTIISLEIFFHCARTVKRLVPINRQVRMDR